MNRETEHPARSGDRIIREGRNCWRTVRADRLAFLIDAAAYFRMLKAAALRARRSILIVGWDVHSRTPLGFDADADPNVPNRLGPFLGELVSRRQGLEIRVLVWDSPFVYAPDRERLPQAQFDWFAHPRLDFALDSQHPVGASHHQKLVVIDDTIAFVGGVDLTGDRLDDPTHPPDDPRRVKPDGTPYGPYHDVQVAVDGAAAAALGEVARDRWARARGEALPATDSGADCWPDDLDPDLTGVDVAIARTDPAWKGRPEVREIESLYLDAIAQAEASVYIENQYFTGKRIAQEMIERLGEPDGPEFVVVVPRRASGWLEETAMGRRQRLLLSGIRDADRHGRFRAYSPVVGESGDVGVKVHSKLMIVDGRFVCAGSANLNNRSMGLDTELDLAIEGPPDSVVARGVADLRNRLIAEHLNIAPDRLVGEWSERTWLLETIERLRGPGRSLAPFPYVSPDRVDTALANFDVLDPAGPAEPERMADEWAADRVARTTLRQAFLNLGAIIALLIAFAALWRWGPLAELAEPTRLQAWGEMVRHDWIATAGVLAVYVLGGLVMFPVTALIAATGLLYGPIEGLLVAGTGSLLSAVTGYAIGAVLGHRTLRRVSGEKVERVSRQIARRGIVSMLVIRLLPVAPFTLINLAAGASHIRFRDFVAGTVLGMAPGIVAITLFSGQVARVVYEPDTVSVAILGGLLVVIAGTAAWAWRRFVDRRGEANDA